MSDDDRPAASPSAGPPPPPVDAPAGSAAPLPGSASPSASPGAPGRSTAGAHALEGGAGTAARAPSGGFLRELPVLVVVAFALALVIKAFLVQAFYIPSGSMEQTLAISDRVLVNKVVYDLRDIRRGEVIVFDGAGSFSPDLDQQVLAEPGPVQRALRAVGRVTGFGPAGEQDFIKRVVGLPGDRVACCTDGDVTVQPAGGEPVALDERYTYENEEPMAFCQAGTDEVSCPPGAPGVLVPEGRLFVLGDHRCCSSDSRLHLDDGQRGTVPESEVIGRAFVVVWPLDRATLLGVPSAFDGPSLALAAGAPAVPYALGALGAAPVALLRQRRRRRPR